MKNNYFSDIVWHCNYQLVLVPRNMATSAFCILRRELETIFANICCRLEVDILSLEISPNHVYIQLSIHPRNSPIEVVRSLKNISSSELFQRYSGLSHILEGIVNTLEKHQKWRRQRSWRKKERNEGCV